MYMLFILISGVLITENLVMQTLEVNFFVSFGVGVEWWWWFWFICNHKFLKEQDGNEKDT